MYDLTCLVTGKKDNLRMHATRNGAGQMIGWVFLHESVKIEELDATINWNWKVKVN